MTKILLDIMYEDLVMLFSNLKWIVKTVSQRLGVTKQAKDDKKVLHTILIKDPDTF